MAKPEPHEAKTLGEACANGDGTYNGLRMMQFLFSAVTGGKEISEQEVQDMWEQAKSRRREK